jgi:aryl-alcohol dehydrogenase-like predicted oxidoreductase
MSFHQGQDLRGDGLERRTVLKLLAATAAMGLSPSAAIASESRRSASTMATRQLRPSGEKIPVIGLGSADTFNVDTSASSRAPLADVLRGLVAGGGSVVDTSPMYGNAETVIGDLVHELGLREKLWLATKVWTRGRDAGREQIEQSFARLRTQHLELLQVHNLLDWREHLPTIRELQEDGRVRYAGITHYRADMHGELERVLAAERFDWLQVNYSLAEPEADARLLPFCQERGIAVMVNRPFADGALFSRVKDRSLPPWAAEAGCASWGQFFLRWILANPAVTCVIPATSKPKHLADNSAAGLAPLPDAAQRRRMTEYWRSL